ncbi:hypothetical protein [Microlunatus spumicola]|uniref:hypothetical protein n=1 Tax=Microlunatus spumicola TaxID=81499 RepID=UPI00195BC526
MVQALVVLLGLGLVMAFSPTTFGIELRTARDTSTVWRRVAVVTLGVVLAAVVLAGVTVAFGTVLLSALSRDGLRHLLTLRWLDLVAALLLVLAGTWRWLRRGRPTRRARRRTDLDRPGVLLAVVAGESLVSTTGPATMYLVVRTVASTSVDLRPLDVLVFLVGLVAPYLALGAVIARLPVDRAVSARAARHQRVWQELTALALVLAGLALGLVVVVGR